MVNVPEVLGLPGLDADLARVDETLHRSVAADDPLLTEMAGHLLGAGGKRFRPALTVASAIAGGGGVGDDVVLGACSVELVHLGSLYHDDVMDEALTRRSVVSANARWGDHMAILAGDFLLAKASEIAAGLGTEVSALLARTIGRLCDGQVREVRTSFDVDRTEDSYLASIRGKTASLLSAACRIGGLTTKLPATTTDSLTAFGEAFGVVFQIVDDVKDLVLTDEELGKPAGNDLVEGVYTLPVIAALREDSAGPELRGLLGRPLDLPERDKARDIVRASTGIAVACAAARAWADRARDALAPLPTSAVVTGLGGLGHRLVDELPA